MKKKYASWCGFSMTPIDTPPLPTPIPCTYPSPGCSLWCHDVPAYYCKKRDAGMYYNGKQCNPAEETSAKSNQTDSSITWERPESNGSISTATAKFASSKAHTDISDFVTSDEKSATIMNTLSPFSTSNTIKINNHQNENMDLSIVSGNVANENTRRYNRRTRKNHHKRPKREEPIEKSPTDSTRPEDKISISTATPPFTSARALTDTTVFLINTGKSTTSQNTISPIITSNTEKVTSLGKFHLISSKLLTNYYQMLVIITYNFLVI